jgi:aspartyl aminopeptidase
VHWQSTILGEVDRGGGGTVAKFFAERGVTVVDAGTPVFGMHSPFELLSKADLYETYRAYKVFLEGGDV